MRTMTIVCESVEDFYKSIDQFEQEGGWAVRQIVTLPVAGLDYDRLIIVFEREA